MNSGVFLCALAAMLMGFLPSLMNCFLRSGVTQAGCILIPNMMICPLCLLWCLRKGKKLTAPPKQLFLLTLSGALGMGVTGLLLTTAYTMLPTGTVMVIHFLYPTAVTLASVAFLHRRASSRLIAAAALSVAGMACISLQGSLSGGGLRGYVPAVLSAFTYAAFIIMSDLCTPHDMELPAVMAWLSLGALLTGVLWALCGHDPGFPDSVLMWMLGGLYTVIVGSSFSMLNAGIHRAGAVSSAFATLLEPVTAVACGVAFFGDPFTARSAAGFAMVLGAVALNALPSKSR